MAGDKSHLVWTRHYTACVVLRGSQRSLQILDLQNKLLAFTLPLTQVCSCSAYMALAGGCRAWQPQYSEHAVLLRELALVAAVGPEACRSCSIAGTHHFRLMCRRRGMCCPCRTAWWR